MYEAFDSFIKVDTWYTGHPCDEGRFYQALNLVVSSEEFDPEKMATYLQNTRGRSAKEDGSYFALAIDDFRARAQVVRDFISFNGLLSREPVTSATSPDREVVSLSSRPMAVCMRWRSWNRQSTSWRRAPARYGSASLRR